MQSAKVVLIMWSVFNPAPNALPIGNSIAPAVTQTEFTDCGSLTQCMATCVGQAQALWDEQAQMPNPTRLWVREVCIDTSGRVKPHWFGRK